VLGLLLAGGCEDVMVYRASFDFMYSIHCGGIIIIRSDITWGPVDDVNPTAYKVIS
jgi:hypothetical protein